MRPSQPKYMYKMALHNLILVIIEGIYFILLTTGYFLYETDSTIMLLIILFVKIILRIFSIISKWNRDKSGLIATIIDILKFLSLIFQVIIEIIMIISLSIHQQYYRFDFYFIIISVSYTIILPIFYVIFFKARNCYYAEKITEERSREKIIQDYIEQQTLKQSRKKQTKESLINQD